jgi:hypothetical protein
VIRRGPPDLPRKEAVTVAKDDAPDAMALALLAAGWVTSCP